MRLRRNYLHENLGPRFLGHRNLKIEMFVQMTCIWKRHRPVSIILFKFGHPLKIEVETWGKKLLMTAGNPW